MTRGGRPLRTGYLAALAALPALALVGYATPRWIVPTGIGRHPIDSPERHVAAEAWRAFHALNDNPLGRLAILGARVVRVWRDPDHCGQGEPGGEEPYHAWRAQVRGLAWFGVPLTTVDVTCGGWSSALARPPERDSVTIETIVTPVGSARWLDPAAVRVGDAAGDPVRPGRGPLRVTAIEGRWVTDDERADSLPGPRDGAVWIGTVHLAGPVVLHAQHAAGTPAHPWVQGGTGAAPSLVCPGGALTLDSASAAHIPRLAPGTPRVRRVTVPRSQAGPPFRRPTRRIAVTEPAVRHRELLCLAAPPPPAVADTLAPMRGRPLIGAAPPGRRPRERTSRVVVNGVMIGRELRRGVRGARMVDWATARLMLPAMRGTARLSPRAKADAGSTR